jgi:4-aminobutyrate aminotransferase-like enzyme
MQPKTLTRIAGASKKCLPLRQFSAVAGSTKYYQNLQEKYVSQSYKKSAPVVVQKGEGASLYDIEGKKYIDMVAGFGAVS